MYSRSFLRRMLVGKMTDFRFHNIPCDHIYLLEMDGREVIIGGSHILLKLWHTPEGGNDEE